MDGNRKSALAFSLVVLMIISIGTPLLSLVPAAQAGSGSVRHIYTFSDGSVEATALYQGSSPDSTNSITIPKGAEVTDIEMTLQGASATGWSQVESLDRSDWMKGDDNNVDKRSDILTLGLDSPNSACQSCNCFSLSPSIPLSINRL